MNPIYEKKQEDWARRTLCHKLGIYAKGLSKNTQWHSIVSRVANLKDASERLVAGAFEDGAAWGEDRNWR